MTFLKICVGRRMGAQNGKLETGKVKFENLDDRDVGKMRELFEKYQAKNGRIDLSQFKAAFPILNQFSTKIFDYLKDAKDNKVTIPSVLQMCNSAFGTYSEQSEILKNLFANDIISNIVTIYSKANAISNHEKLIRYFNETNRFGNEKFDMFLLENPLFVKMSQFVFSSILSKVSKPIQPNLQNVKSSLLDSSDLLVLNSHLPMDQQKKWTLLFSSASMGDSFSQMVKRINREGSCIVLIRSENQKTFGFFASAGFQSGPLYHGNEQCFLFEIGKDNINLYSSTGRENNYAYLNYQQQSLPNGLGIGGKEDVWPVFIHEEYGSGICQKDSVAFEKCFVAGEKEFQIETMEVWRVGEKPVNRDENGDIIPEKKEKSIIDKDPEARAVLEMAGKPMHSDIYRDPPPLLDEEDETP
ncbi:unnamed protein product [Caenorhabditis angaria]|uniref:MTOR-associated protein MEAK7 n=1 Tax=Caenorhabditis angaria TaxID=860376 RepID=A0A9P1MWX1_9PELO|nr:unnamed protein product [Caenorhabditis angaria]